MRKDSKAAGIAAGRVRASYLMLSKLWSVRL